MQAASGGYEGEESKTEKRKKTPIINLQNNIKISLINGIKKYIMTINIIQVRKPYSITYL